MTKTRRFRLLRGFLVLILVIVAIPLGFVGVTLLRASGGLPEWQGSIRLAGLDAPVEVVRDANGVPHIFADTERDAMFAEGFVHAQDRLWQMMSTRQLMAGRMAEWFGAGALHGDRLNRAQKFAALAREDFARMPAGERDLLTAYADGVNAYLNSNLYRRPPEMVLLFIDPEPWNAHDSMLVYGGVWLQLMMFGSEIMHTRLADFAGHPRAVTALDPLPWGVRPIIEDERTPNVSLMPNKVGAFSDSWLLDGSHTRSGKPLLANDPQLPSTLPNFWYLVHLSVNGQNRVGGSLPGVPGIAVGRNERLAWGVTNGTVDQADMALLHGHPDNPGLYRRLPTDDWTAFTPREETFKVRFGETLVETFYETQLGFELRQELLQIPVSKIKDARVEVRTPYLEGSRSISTILALNRAQTVADAVQALAYFTGPSLNFSLADVDGNIGYVSAGRYADRKDDAARIIDFAPRDGSEWEPIPFSENPQVTGPFSGRIVTANQPPVGPDYPHYLSDFWAAPHRALRIHELLDKGGPFDRDSFLAMQMDTLSGPARRYVPRLLALAPESRSEVEEAMLQSLSDWDFRFQPDSAAPTVFLTWLQSFHEVLARDELGEQIWPRMANDALPLIALQVLDGRNSDWCETVGSETVTDCREIVRRSLAQAARRLQDTLGPAPGDWRWGDACKIVHPHLAFDGWPLLGKLFSRVSDYPGGPDTLMTKYVEAASAPRFTRSTFASSYQAIYDLADLDASLFMISTGQSGHFRSPYYDNFLERFAAGERFTIPTRRSDIEPRATLVLAEP